MKKLFTFLIVGVLTASGAVAQKGDWALSGSLTFDYSSPEWVDGMKNGESLIYFQVAPSLLYGFSENFYFGGELSASMNYYKDYLANEKIADGYKNMFGIAPIARCYFHHHRRVAFFNDTKVGFYLGTDKAETTYMAVNASITPGIEVFLNSSFSVSASLNEVLGIRYEYASPKGSDNSTDKVDVRFLFNRMELNYAPLTFSFTYHFPKRERVVEVVEIQERRMR